MAAKVTRTITTTNATLFCGIKDKNETTTVEITLTGKFNDNAAIIKAAAKKIDENLVIISVSDVKVKQALYVMAESDFIANATVKEDK